VSEAEASLSVHVCGGQDSILPFPSVWHYDVTEDKWLKSTRTTIETLWAAYACCQKTQTIISSGGFDLEGLITTNMSSTQCFADDGSLFKARYMHSMAVASNGDIFVGGGLADTTSYLKEDLKEDLKEHIFVMEREFGIWKSCPPMMTARACSACGVARRRKRGGGGGGGGGRGGGEEEVVVVAGGVRSSDQEDFDPCDVVEIFSISENRWSAGKYNGSVSVLRFSR
jgi:hypothetical protein